MKDWQDRAEFVLKVIAVALLAAWVYFSLTWVYQLQLIPFVEMHPDCLTADCVPRPLP